MIDAVTANQSSQRGITCDTMYDQYLDLIQGGTASYSRQKNVWWYRDTFTEPQDMHFCIIGGGIYIYKVTVSDAPPATTGVVSPKTQKKGDTSFFTLGGTRLKRPTLPGIYLCGGRKVVMR